MNDAQQPLFHFSVDKSAHVSVSVPSSVAAGSPAPSFTFSSDASIAGEGSEFRSAVLGWSEMSSPLQSPGLHHSLSSMSWHGSHSHPQPAQPGPASYLRASPARSPYPASAATFEGSSSQHSHSGSLIEASKLTSSAMAQQDSMYEALPTYRFPPMPSPHIHQTYQAQQPGFIHRSPMHSYERSHGLVADAHSVASPTAHSTMYSPSVSPSPSFRATVVPQLAPALPIITLPESGYLKGESTTHPGASIKELESFDATPLRDGDLSPQRGSKGDTPRSAYLGVSYDPSALQQSPSVLQDPHASQPDSGGYHYTTTTTSSFHYQNTSPSTFVPSSSYLPTRPAFGSLTPTMPSLPRSAPSTPLGRQDARFLSNTRNWTTPQLYQPVAFPPYPTAQQQASVPGISAGLSQSVGPSYTSRRPPPPPLSLHTYYGMDDLDSPSDRGSPSLASSHPPSGSPYIPYARNARLATPKRGSPYALGSPVMQVNIKKVKKEKSAASSSASPAPNVSGSVDTNVGKAREKAQVSPFNEVQEDEEQKAKPVRCKIACSACRKTRLKCDGLAPCTSCVDKHMKTNPTQSEEEAKQYVADSQACQYENFVRRRGKGKKTLEKERGEQFTRQLVGSSGLFPMQDDGGMFMMHGMDPLQPLHYGLGVQTMPSRSGSSEYGSGFGG